MNTTFNAIVTDVVTETPDTVTLVLDIGLQVNYKAGRVTSRWIPPVCRLGPVCRLSRAPQGPP